MQPDLVIEKVQDWDRFTNPEKSVALDLIVDPMIYRTADVFMRGKSGVSQSFGNSDAVWQAINRNIDSLVIFFDNLILSENLPIIDYGSTFDKHVGFDEHPIIQKCNQTGKTLFQVHVCGAATQEARFAVFETMKSKTVIPEAQVADLQQEMSALEYQWKPDLSPLGKMSDHELPVNRFLYGALLFGAFAQKAGVGHLFQPRRSKVLLAASLHADSETTQDEKKLYKKLKEVMVKISGPVNSTADLDGLPPFLPYLLSTDPKNPNDLLSSALKLRKKGAVKDYRNWRNELVRDWRVKGKIQLKYKKELSSIAQEVQKELQGPKNSSGFELKLSMTGLDPSWKVPVDQIWGWIQSQLPGRRYMKLLTRLTLSQAEYEQIDKHVKTIWSAT